MIKIVLVDDQMLFVESLRNILEMRTEDLRVVGVALDGRQAVEVVERKQPDIVLMDVRMPEMDGVEATRLIHQSSPAIRIMMLTTFDDDEYVRDALANGAVGYLLKTCRPSELIASVRAISEGVFQISPAVAAKLIRDNRKSGEASKSGDGKPRSKPSWNAYLSHREKEILRCVLEGLSNKQISERLYISEQTVKNHLSTSYSKMDAHSRPQVIRKLIDADIDLPPF